MILRDIETRHAVIRRQATNEKMVMFVEFDHLLRDKNNLIKKYFNLYVSKYSFYIVLMINTVHGKTTKPCRGLGQSRVCTTSRKY